MLRKTFALEELGSNRKMEKRKKYAVGLAICSCHLISRGDKSRKVRQVEHEGHQRKEQLQRYSNRRNNVYLFHLLACGLLKVPLR